MQSNSWAHAKQGHSPRPAVVAQTQKHSPRKGLFPSCIPVPLATGGERPQHPEIPFPYYYYRTRPCSSRRRVIRWRNIASLILIIIWCRSPCSPPLFRPASLPVFQHRLIRCWALLLRLPETPGSAWLRLPPLSLFRKLAPLDPRWRRRIAVAGVALNRPWSQDGNGSKGPPRGSFLTAASQRIPRRRRPRKSITLRQLSPLFIYQCCSTQPLSK
jgi:hypothetical protein